MRPRPLYLLAVLITLALATWLRFFRLDAQSYWNDEGNSLRLAERAPAEIVAAAAADIHPPGYYLALSGWRALTGPSEFALRGFSALVGVALVALVYRLGQQYFDRATGLGAALLAALHPFLIYYSQEARMYALLAALSAASFLLFSRWLKSSRPPAPAWGQPAWAAAYVLVTAAGLYTHYAFGFVVIAENLAAFGGLAAHRGRGGGGRLAAWLGLQAAALLLFLPWLPTALRQLTTWPADRAAQPFVAALLDLARYLTFGRTLPTAAAGLGLLGALGLLAFGLARRGQTVTPALWLFVPAALTLSFGLLTEAFAKFLLVAVPPLLLLLGNGLAAIPPGPFEPGWKRTRQRAGEYAALAVWLAAVTAYGAATFASLNNLYFNPADARDDYRAIARDLAAAYQPGDAIILISPNQYEVFTVYHPDHAEGTAALFPLPATRPLDPAATTAALEQIAAAHPRLFVLFWGEGQADPAGVVEGWLNTHAFKAGDRWYGQVRLATYAAAQPATQPQVTLAARFGEHIALTGYALQPAQPRPGGSVQLTLFWRTDAALEARYKVFVHIYADENAPPVAQQDGEPGGGLALTSGWTPGVVIADNHGVLLPDELAPGRYVVYVGLTELFSGERLPVALDGAAAGDRLRLTEVEIP
ncbi:MAG: glycosyltransferase family 39 protein [Anaerolineales bacterium]|nr:glycosyltransferase family 39 protein [Anaerolineales bacterium]